MKALASFIMRGRTQATLVAIVGAVLSLMLPPMFFITGATIGLITLRNGLKEGLFILLALGLIIGVIGSMSSLGSGLVQAYVVMTLLLSVPVLLAATILRITRSLAHTLAAIALLVALLVLLANALLGDTAAWWREVLDSVMLPILTETQLSAEEANKMLDEMAHMMTARVAVMLLYATMISLSLARWFQAMLYNPGGFQQEFHTLFLGKHVAIAAALIGAAGMVFAAQGEGGLAQDLMILVVALFSIHGLALVHGMVGMTGMGRGWLIALYIGLLLIPPVGMILAMIGYIDSWADLRGRLRRQYHENGPTEINKRDDDNAPDDDERR